MKRKLYVIGLLGLLLSVVTGCRSKEASATSETAANNADAKEIVVGVGTSYKPFIYLDENNELQGYDLEVLKAVDDLLPQYKFKYEPLEFKNILTSLEAGKIQIGAHEFEKNEERAKKYLYGEEGYNGFDLYITYKEGNYQTLADLAGKKVFTTASGNPAYVLEQYNLAHPETASDLVYGDYLAEIIVKSLENESVDATLTTKFDVKNFNQQFNADLKIADEPSNLSKAYFLFPKAETTLQKDVDEAIVKLKENGELDRISKEILGDIYYK